MPLRWRAHKGTVVDVCISVCKDAACGGFPFQHRHCPCGCGSVTTTQPLGLRVCDACGKVCFHNEWDRPSQFRLCAGCRRKTIQRRRAHDPYELRLIAPKAAHISEAQPGDVTVG